MKSFTVLQRGKIVAPRPSVTDVKSYFNALSGLKPVKITLKFYKLRCKLRPI